MPISSESENTDRPPCQNLRPMGAGEGQGNSSLGSDSIKNIQIVHISIYPL